jgi:hypothetical protein
MLIIENLIPGPPLTTLNVLHGWWHLHTAEPLRTKHLLAFPAICSSVRKEEEDVIYVFLKQEVTYSASSVVQRI